MKIQAIFAVFTASILQLSAQSGVITFGMETDLSPSSTTGDVGGATVTLGLGNPGNEGTNYTITFTDGDNATITRLDTSLSPIAAIGSNGLKDETGRNLGPVSNSLFTVEITTGSTPVSFDSLSWALDGSNDRQHRFALYNPNGGQVGKTQQTIGGTNTITVNGGATETDGSGSFNGVIPPNSTRVFYLDTGFNLAGGAPTSIITDSISVNLRPVGLVTFGMETDLSVSGTGGDIGGATVTLTPGNPAQENVNYSIAFNDGNNATINRLADFSPLGDIGSNGLGGETGRTLGGAANSLFVLQITTGATAVRLDSLSWSLDATNDRQHRYALYDSNLAQIGATQQTIGGTSNLVVNGAATEIDGSGSFNGTIPSNSTATFYLDTGFNFAGGLATSIITDSISLVLNPTIEPSTGKLDATVVFTGPKSGVFTVNSITGFTYLLRASEDLSGEGFIVSQFNGTGGPLELPFDDSAFSFPKYFFWVEEVPASE